jgi:hypothetical protein
MGHACRERDAGLGGPGHRGAIGPYHHGIQQGRYRHHRAAMKRERTGWGIAREHLPERNSDAVAAECDR